MREPVSTSLNETRRLSRAAFVIVFLGAGTAGLLAGATQINGAVIADGYLVVDSYVKNVENLKGGTVETLYVQNGDHVAEGDLLVRLDDTQAKAGLGIITHRLIETKTKAARLTAEQSGNSFDGSMPAYIGVSGAAEWLEAIRSELKLFDERQASRDGRKQQLKARTEQFRQQIDGIEAQMASKRREIDFIQKELTGQRHLLDQGIVSVTKVYALEREDARLSGEMGSFRASIAEIKGKISETELQIIQVDDDFRSDVAEKLRQAQSEEGELRERLIAAQDDLRRVEIKSPQSGVVHQLAIHAKGAVITPSQPIMQIVPTADTLTAEIRLSPRDVDQVETGQEVVLRFSGLNQPGTPDANGRVARVSPDLSTDQRTNATYYTVRVEVEWAGWQHDYRRALPGMPVEAFIKTGTQPAYLYFAKPITDQMSRAFKES